MTDFLVGRKGKCRQITESMVTVSGDGERVLLEEEEMDNGGTLTLPTKKRL